MSKSFVYGAIVGIGVSLIGVTAASQGKQDYTKEAEAQRESRLFDKEVVDATPTQLGVLADRLRMTGADIHSVATLLGHKDIRMTARCSHLNPAFLGETIGKLDTVYDNLRCQDVASQNLLTDGEATRIEHKQLAAMV